MPTVKQIGPYSSRFYASDEHEPPHIHVVRGWQRAKFWLDPVLLADGGKFRSHELRDIEKLVEGQQAYFLEQWHDYFN